MKKTVFQILNVIIAEVAINAVMLLLLSFLLYKFRFSDGVVRAGIILTYIVSNFVGGFIMGKIKENKKYLWGAVVGLAYFLILVIVSVAVTKELFGNGNMAVIALLCSVIGGITGGMLS